MISNPWPIYTLLKFGKLENLRLLQQGKIYCRQTTYYSKKENSDQCFYDEHESLINIAASEIKQLTISYRNKENLVIPGKNFSGRIKIQQGRSQAAFCLHKIQAINFCEQMITSENCDRYFDELTPSSRMKDFGDHIWHITDLQEFNRRLLTLCERHGLYCTANSVIYRDRLLCTSEEQTQHFGFLKDTKYAHEREFRYLFESCVPDLYCGDPFILNMGDLHDISEVKTYDDFLKSLSYEFVPDSI